MRERRSHRPGGFACRRGALVLALVLTGCGGSSERSGSLDGRERPFAPFRHDLGAFAVALEGSDWPDARLVVTHRARPERPVFESLPGRAFLDLGRGQATLVEGAVVEDAIQERCVDQMLDAVEAELTVLRLSGALRCRVLERAYELFLVPEGRDALRFHVRLSDPSFDRIAFTWARAEGERLFGLGARDVFALEGGRHAGLVTAAAAPPRGGFGRWFGAAAPPAGSRAPAHHVFGTAGRAWIVESPAYAAFDFRRDDALRFEVHANELTWRIVSAEAPQAQVRAATRTAGPIVAPPAWVHAGPILDFAGDDEALSAQLESLAELGVLPSAVYVRGAPPGPALATRLAASGVRVLQDAAPFAGPEAADGLLVEVADGEAGSLVDLSRPEARAWLARRFAAGPVASGASGLVLRGGAALPFGARLFDDRPSEAAHNRYAAWLTATAAQTFAEQGRRLGAVLTEVAFTGSAANAAVWHAGPARDPATLARVLSAGLSGFAVPWVTVGASEAEEDVVVALGLAAFTPVWSVAAAALDEEAARSALARAARLHAAWAGYRGELLRRAESEGLPVLRPLWLHYPDEPAFQTAEPESFLIGSELLVVPVRDGSERVDATLPPGRWIDVFSGEVHGALDAPARRARLAAAPGLPAVLHPEGSIVGERLRKAVAALGR